MKKSIPKNALSVIRHAQMLANYTLILTDLAACHYFMSGQLLGVSEKLELLFSIM